MGAKFCLPHLAIQTSGRSFVFLMKRTEMAKSNSDMMLEGIKTNLIHVWWLKTTETYYLRVLKVRCFFAVSPIGEGVN